MEINNQSDMAKLLKAAIAGDDTDNVFNYLDNLEVQDCIVNTFTIRDKETGKSYLVNVKLVK